MTIQLLTKQQRKSLEVKKMIFEATVNLLKTYGYNFLTVRNICQAAGVSTGSFYHHFKNKDDLLSYYLSQGFSNYVEQHPFETTRTIIETCRNVYGTYATYCEAMGLKFISHFYSVENKALDTYAEQHNDLDNLIAETLIVSLRQAKEKGQIKAEISIDEVYNEMCMIVKGCIFEWALSEGRFGLKHQVEKMLEYYLNNIVTK